MPSYRLQLPDKLHHELKPGSWKSQPQAGATVSQAARCAVGPVPVEQHRLAGRPRQLPTETGPAGCSYQPAEAVANAALLAPARLRFGVGWTKPWAMLLAQQKRGAVVTPPQGRRAGQGEHFHSQARHAALAGDVEPLEMRGPLLCALGKDGIEWDFYFFYPFSVDFQLVVLSLLLRVKTKGGKKRHLLVSHLFTRLISPQGQRRVQGSPTDACTW